MSPKSSPRIKDIAQMAGVSIGTVDRVLHNRGEVSEITREKILKIAKDLDYTPNLMARALKSNKKQKLVALLPEATIDNSFWFKHQSGLEDGMKQLEPYNVSLDIVLFDLHLNDDFSHKADQVLAMNPSGVLLAPIFKHESLSFCKLLSNLKIPFVFVDSFIQDSEFLAYIGEDAYQSGRVAAQLIDYGTEAHKDVLIVNMAKNLENTIHLNNRTQGFLSYFIDKGINNGEKINLEIKSPEFNQVAQSLEGVLGKHPNIGAVFVTGSMTYKIAHYLEVQNRHDIILVGYDIVERNVQYLRNGIIHFLISQRPSEQTEKAVMKLFEYISSERLPLKMEYLPIDVVMSENVDYFL